MSVLLSGNFINYIRERWFVVLFIIPVSVYLFLLVKYAQNIPATDDFHATLLFIDKFLFEKLDYVQRISLLFSQHNEHRIVVSRLLSLLLYALTDEINFIHFVIIDSLFLFGLIFLLFLIYTEIQPTIYWISYLLPISLLLSAKTYETFIFVSGGSQAYTVLFFTVLSMYLLSLSCSAKGNKRSFLFVSSVGSAVLATFSFGSGFLVWGGGIIFLYYSDKWKYLMVWIFISLLVCGGYFYDFHKSSAGVSYNSIERITGVLKGFVLFPGASFLLYWPHLLLTKISVLLCYCIGLLSCLYSLYLFATNYGRRCPLLFSLLTIAMGISAILAVSRSGSGSAFVFTSRYMVFTSFTAVIIYGILVQQRIRIFYNRKWVVVPLLLLFVNSLLISLPAMDIIYRDRQAGFVSWYDNGTPTLYIDEKWQLRANQIVRRSIQTKVFIPPVVHERLLNQVGCIDRSATNQLFIE